jgi:hypothetical protein
MGLVWTNTLQQYGATIHDMDAGTTWLPCKTPAIHDRPGKLQAYSNLPGLSITPHSAFKAPRWLL